MTERPRKQSRRIDDWVSASSQADSRAVTTSGRTALPINDCNIKLTPTPIHSAWKLIYRYIDRFGRSSDKNITFCQRLPRPYGRGPEIKLQRQYHSQWMLILGMINATRKLTNVKNVCRRSEGIASFSTFTMVSGTFERVGCRRFARKSVEIKGTLSQLPISVKSLIIEELDLFNNFINFEPTFIRQREAPTNYRIRVRGLISRMQRKQTDEPYRAVLRD